ncbi:glycogen debranching N-terminal domain-containing protein [Tersicoccus sp. MR15.9]|uniref:amylo-alpha-1,6-glucosidase n=1 Tax=Tersicoccus mangrovi TaxID=3121635 RepID=UPI002FE51390
MSVDQPALHDAVVVLSAPIQVWSARDGSVGTVHPGAGAAPRGVDGIYCGDDRVIHAVDLTVQVADGDTALGPRLEFLGAVTPGGGTAGFDHVLRVPGPTADPAVTVRRTRTTDGSGAGEAVLVRSALDRALPLRITAVLWADSSRMDLIKAGHATTPHSPRVESSTWHWRDDATTARVVAQDAHLAPVTDGDVRGIALTWDVVVPANGEHSVSWRLELHDDQAVVGPAPSPAPAHPVVDTGTALGRLVRRASADLAGLRMSLAAAPEHPFLAAGAPWFFTLFGRDSLIAARLMLPVDRELAVGTVRALARLQGTRTDPETGEQPGRIPHEVRRTAADLADDRSVLPPLYYGTIDATCLWITLVAELDAAGETTTARELTPALLQALRWLRDESDADGDGFLEYFDTSGHGLANQGWKDSGDSIRFADGTIATGAIALCEVQGYAHQAACEAARLLRRHGDLAEAVAADLGLDPALADPEQWERWADALRERFADTFWVRDADGPYPALALDGQKRPVDGVASNMGHLIGTGLLDRAQESLVVERLMGPSMFSGYGIRTMSTANGAYWPLRYHVGSVWTHDTAMILDGMLRQGHSAPARRLAEGLLHAAEGFDFQLPELFSGEAADDVWPPQPYPASCHPQAWAAASWVVVARAMRA